MDETIEGSSRRGALLGRRKLGQEGLFRSWMGRLRNTLGLKTNSQQYGSSSKKLKIDCDR